jgi:hypothetical protein
MGSSSLDENWSGGSLNRCIHTYIVEWFRKMAGRLGAGECFLNNKARRATCYVSGGANCLRACNLAVGMETHKMSHGTDRW